MPLLFLSQVALAEIFVQVPGTGARVNLQLVVGAVCLLVFFALLFAAVVAIVASSRRRDDER